MMRLPKPMACCLMISACALLCLSWQAAAPDDGRVHLADIASLESAQVDALLALPAVDGWVELGDTALLVGALGLDEVLADFAPDMSVRSVPRDGRQLGLLRFGCAADAGALPEGVSLLAGRSRYAVALVSEAAAQQLGSGVFADLVLERLPFGEALIQRADRAFGASPLMASSTPIFDAVAAAADLDAYTDVVADLVGFGTRYSHHTSFPDVTSYVSDELTALGFSVTLDPFTLGSKTRHNVIAEITGDVTPDDVYIVCGHYDSTSQSPNSSAPGADDNASGAAAVIEMARVLRPYRFDSTIRFICFAGEEQGLVGSAAYVSDLIAAGELGDVQGVINMDMIGYLNTGTWDVLLEGKAGTSQPLLNLLSNLVGRYTSLTPFVSTNPYGSDHMPFINQGVNAVLTIEYQDGANPNYHKTSDTLGTLTLPFALEIVKLNLIATASMAGIKGGYQLEYGAGVAGSGGFVPDLNGGGSTNLGEPFSVRLEDGLGGASAYLVIGTASASLPKFGGTILVDPASAVILTPVLQGAPGVPGAGWKQIDAAVPNDPGLTGLSAYIQYVLVDAGAPTGKSLSDALEFVFGI